MKRITVKLIFLSTLIALFAGCSMGGDDGDDIDTTPRATGISFVRNNVTIDGAEDMYLQYTVTPKEIQNKVHVQWTYDNKMVALDPDNYGVVIHPKAAGTTYIRATVDGHTAACLLTMTGNPDIYEGKPYLYSNFTTVEMQPGQRATVTAMLYSGSSSDYENMKWSISDTSVATIDYARGSCIITERKNGSARITVHHDKSAFDYNMIVYVSDSPFTNPFITTR